MTRMKRNYVFLILAAYIGWSFKLIEQPVAFSWAFFVPVTVLMVAGIAYVAWYKDERVDV